MQTFLSNWKIFSLDSDDKKIGNGTGLFSI